MPALNVGMHKELFEASINSIVSQSYRDWELLIGIDGDFFHTTKEVKKIVTRLKDPRIKTFKAKCRQGPAIMRNSLFKYCQGDLITFHDSDDFSVRDRFEILIDYLNNSEEHIVASNIIIKYMYHGCKNSARIKGFTGADTLETLIGLAKVRPPIIMSSAVLTKDLFIKLGGFEKYKYHTDALFAVKLGLFRDLGRSPAIHVIKKPLFTWNRHSRSITTTGGATAQVFEKERECQELSLISDFRDDYLNGEIKIGLGEDEIMAALGIQNNLKNTQELLRFL